MGYDWDENGKWVVNPVQAAVVQYIYENYADGLSATEIARRLNAHGIKTARGNTFRSDVILRILRSELYARNLILQKNVTVEFLSHKTVKNENHTPKYFIEGHHPAIISPELLKFEDAVYRKFIKKGTVMGDEIVYETNFGVTLRSYGNIRTLRHFFGFKKVSADGTIGVVLGVWEVRDSKLFQPGIRKKHAEEDSTALETLNA